MTRRDLPEVARGTARAPLRHHEPGLGQDHLTGLLFRAVSWSAFIRRQWSLESLSSVEFSARVVTL